MNGGVRPAHSMQRACFSALRMLWGRLLLAVWGAAAAGAWAAAPSAVPQFRVDAAMHTAEIGQIRPDWPRNRVVTLGSDRTVRLWQLPSLRLIRVFRLPQEGAIEGLPLGLAVSPDGRTIAVAGWTGITWEKKASIYIFDSATGRMLRRVGAFADVISALDWSPDGRYLAVGIGGTAGLKVLSTADWEVAAEDTAYNGPVSFVHFSSSGWLAAAAGDGSVRLYDAQHKLMARQSVGISRALGGVRFSPDGKLLALGIVDKPMAVLLKVPTLELASVRKAPDPQQKGMCCIAWARDGSALYLNGEHEGTGPTPLYRFDDAGQGAPRRLPVGNQRFANMLPLPGGGMLFATTTPSLTLLSPGGEVLRTVSSVIGDFRDGQRHLLLSAKADAISLPMARSGGRPRLFAVSGLDDSPTSLDAADLRPARLEAEGFALEAFVPADAPARPKVNGKPLEIIPSDQVQAHAFAHDGSALFVGTRWQLLKLDRQAQVLWRQSFSSAVRAVNAAADGAFVVITLSDGTARWLRQSDGQEVLAFFPHNNGHDWVLWRPDGYYASSEEGDQYVGWHVNRGMDRAPDFYRAVQFERVFYRPDLLRTALTQAPPVTRGGTPLSMQLEPIAPARLSIDDVRTRLNSRGRVEITLQVSAQAHALPMQQLAVYVNGLPVTPTRQRPLAGPERTRVQRTLTVESDSRENDIRVEIDHGQSLGLAETFAELAPDVSLPSAPAARGRLFVVAIGINKFVNVPAERKERLQDLEFAAQDAQAFAEAMQRSARSLYREVKTVLLNDMSAVKPDKREIRSALATLQEAGPDDTVMVFLASHGFSDRAGNYFFMARDGQYGDIEKVVESDNAAGDASSLVEGDDFFGALRQVAGRRILIVDTCHARRIEGLVDTHSLRKRSAASNLAFMVAAKGNEQSQEYSPAGHGLFTYALLESLDPAAGADANGDGAVTLRESFEYLAPMVQKLRHRGLRQTPQLIAPAVLMAEKVALSR